MPLPQDLLDYADGELSAASNRVEEIERLLARYPDLEKWRINASIALCNLHLLIARIQVASQENIERLFHSDDRDQT
jgi:hypothetical protein